MKEENKKPTSAATEVDESIVQITVGCNVIATTTVSEWKFPK